MIEIIETGISKLLLIKTIFYKDNRGGFKEQYNKQLYSKLIGDKYEFVQDNLSVSKKHVLRGLHFQAPPFQQAKLVSVIKGEVLDVVVDIRKDSKTYGKHYSVILNEENNLQLCIPEGFAHGFLALKENTVFYYKCSNFYNKEHEGAILWNDIDLNIKWGVENPIISEKDMIANNFKNFVSPF